MKKVLTTDRMTDSVRITPIIIELKELALFSSELI